METIYEWLYENYYRPHAGEVRHSEGDQEALEAAERLLLTGEGGQLERRDALNTLCRVHGTAAFAAGVCFGWRSVLDMAFISDIALDGRTLVL